MSLAILSLTLYRKPYESGICILLLAAGIPFYVIGTLWEKPNSIQDKLGEFQLLDFVVCFIPAISTFNVHF